MQSVLEPHYDSLEDVSDYIRELVHEAVLHCKDVTHWLRHHFTAELLAAHPDYFATSKAFADAAGVSSWPLMTIPEVRRCPCVAGCSGAAAATLHSATTSASHAASWPARVPAQVCSTSAPFWQTMAAVVHILSWWCIG